MTLQLVRVRNGDTAKHDAITWLERVDIKTATYPRLHGPAPQQPFRPGKVLRMRDLDVPGTPGRQRYRHSRPFGDRRVVGELPRQPARPHVGGEDLREAKALRRLGGEERVAVLGRGDGLAVGRALNRISHRHDGQGAV